MFGFGRFEEMDNVDIIEKQLDSIWIGKRKIYVIYWSIRGTRKTNTWIEWRKSKIGYKRKEQDGVNEEGLPNVSTSFNKKDKRRCCELGGDRN